MAKPDYESIPKYPNGFYFNERKGQQPEWVKSNVVVYLDRFLDQIKDLGLGDKIHLQLIEKKDGNLTFQFNTHAMQYYEENPKPIQSGESKYAKGGKSYNDEPPF